MKANSLRRWITPFPRSRARLSITAIRSMPVSSHRARRAQPKPDQHRQDRRCARSRRRRDPRSRRRDPRCLEGLQEALSGGPSRLVGRSWRVGVTNHDGRHEATTGRARASSRASLAPSRCDGGWAVAVGARVVGARRGTSESDSACAARALRAVQRGRSGGMVASADAGAVAFTRRGLAYSALAACRSTGRAPGGVLTDETAIALKQPQRPLPWAADGGARSGRR